MGSGDDNVFRRRRCDIAHTLKAKMYRLTHAEVWAQVLQNTGLVMMDRLPQQQKSAIGRVSAPKFKKVLVLKLEARRDGQWRFRPRAAAEAKVYLRHCLSIHRSTTRMGSPSFVLTPPRLVCAVVRNEDHASSEVGEVIVLEDDDAATDSSFDPAQAVQEDPPRCDPSQDCQSVAFSFFVVVGVVDSCSVLSGGGGGGFCQ